MKKEPWRMDSGNHKQVARSVLLLAVHNAVERDESNAWRPFQHREGNVNKRGKEKCLSHQKIFPKQMNSMKFLKKKKFET